MIPKKFRLYYNVGDIAKELNEPPQTIYYWIKAYNLKLPRDKKGSIRLSEENCVTLRRIKHLLRETKMTEKGVKDALNNKIISNIDIDANVLQILNEIEQNLSKMISTMDKYSIEKAKRRYSNEKDQLENN